MKLVMQLQIPTKRQSPMSIAQSIHGCLTQEHHSTSHRTIISWKIMLREITERYILLLDYLWDIVGIGDINLKMSDGRVWKITKVRHVPKLMRNLISVGQLDDTGHDVNFGGGAWRVKKGSMVVARGHKRGTLYMTTSYQDTVAVVENAKQTKL